MHFIVNGLSTAGIVADALTSIALFIDNAIFWMAGLVLRAFYVLIELGDKLSANQEVIQSIIRRLMVLAAIYALFRLAIMLINYLIEPAKIQDGQKTGVALIKKVLIAVMLLVSSSFIFTQLADIEKKVLVGYEAEDGSTYNGLIPMIIYGKENTSVIMKTDIEAKAYVNKIWALFFTPYNKGECETSSKSYCITYNAVLRGDASIMSLAGVTKYFDYMPIAPLIAGVALMYYFVVAVFALIKRIFKMLVLQVIFPIPVILSIDPTSKNDYIGNFFKAYFELYGEVFIRVATFQLAFVVIALFEGILSDDSVGAILKIVLIIGAFKGAKEIPDLIDRVIGTKLAKSGANKSFGSVLSGIVGGGIGLAGGAFLASRGAEGTGFGNRFAAAIAGGAKGAFNGAQNGAKATSISDFFKSGVSNLQNQYKYGGNIKGARGFGAYYRGKAENFFSGKEKDAEALRQYAENKAIVNDKAADRKKEIDKEHETNLKNIQDTQKINREAFEAEHRSDMYGIQSRLNNAKDELTKTNNKLAANSERNQLRSRMTSALDRSFTEKHGSFDNFLANNHDYSEMLQKGASQDELLKKREAVLADYNSRKQNYFDECLTAASVIDDPNYGDAKQYDEATIKAINEYNEYVKSRGMDDRTVDSYEGLKKADAADRGEEIQLREEAAANQERINDINDEMRETETKYQEDLKARQERDAAEIQGENDRYKAADDANEKARKDAVEQIDRNEAAFKDSDGYVRRNDNADHVRNKDLFGVEDRLRKQGRGTDPTVKATKDAPGLHGNPDAKK